MRSFKLKFLSLLLLIFSHLAFLAKTPEGEFAHKLEEVGMALRSGRSLGRGVLARLLEEINHPDFHVNARVFGEDELTPSFLLDIAIRHAPWPIIRRLIELGAETGGNEFAAPATTPLHVALAYERIDILTNLARTFTYLLNERDNTGRTALEVARDDEAWGAYEALSRIQEEAQKKNAAQSTTQSPAQGEERGRSSARTNPEGEREQREGNSRSQERSTSYDGLYDNWDNQEEPSSQDTQDTEIVVDSPPPTQDSAGAVLGQPQQNNTNNPVELVYFVSYNNPLYQSSGSVS